MMPLSTSDQLTRQFYEWEQRGRGWAVYPLAVDLEPPFHPFFGHFTKTAAFETVDDGVRHTLASGTIAFLKRAFKSKPQPEPEYEEEEILPIVFDCNLPLTAFSIVQPKGQKVRMEQAEQLLTMLSYTAWPVSFEILASSDRIRYQIVCRTVEKDNIYNQVKAFFPECILKENRDGLDSIAGNDEYTSVIDYGLSDEFMRPLAIQKNFDLDPFIGVCAALEQLQQGEYASIQILFKGAVNPWAESIMRSVLDNEGRDFFENAPDMVPMAKEKIAAPLFGVTIKVLGEAPTAHKSTQIALMAGNAIGRIFLSKGNSLIPLGGDYDIQDKIDDMFLRQSCRQGMLLNSRELATLVHLPSESVTSSRLERNARKTKAAPSVAIGHRLVLGINEHMGKETSVSISNTQRLKHTHIIGATGTGKSTMLHSMIVQDMQQGNGIAVVDPHGDLIESLLSHVPANRIQDVIVFDPSDAGYPVGFNILSAHSEIEKEILASDLVAVFRRLSTSWGDQMNSVLANAILAILESTKGGTLFDLRRFLIEKSFREEYLRTVTDPSIVYYWQKEFPLLKSGSIGSILTRLDTFLRPKLIRNMVAQKKGLDFENILDGKILFVKLSQGLIGVENSYLLGTFFITKFYQAATARQSKSMEARRDFFVYVDEFQNFITPSMSSILSGARKYHLGLILAHQEMQQLVKYDNELANSVVANAGTRVCFRLGDTDAKRFANGFAGFEQSDLENLNTGQAIVRVERPEYDFTLSTTPLTHIDAAIAGSRANKAIQHSRQNYGTLKATVESLFEFLQSDILPEAKKDATPRTKLNAEIIQESDELITKSAPILAQPQELTTEADLAVRERLVKKQEITQHRYLQSLIKKMAESRGYKANVEELTRNGKGRVDVSLERDGKRIACEICVTTEKDWEVHNIQKCLDAGYDVVISCSSKIRTIDAIRKKVESAFDGQIQQRLFQMLPEQLVDYLDQEIVKSAPTETRVKGYRVKVAYAVPSQQEMLQKKASIGKAILDSKKRKQP